MMELPVVEWLVSHGAVFDSGRERLLNVSSFRSPSCSA